MKLRPVLLVLLLLCGFYYLTTRVASAGALAPWVHRALHPSEPVGGTTSTSTTSTTNGALGAFDLTQASAAPAFDTEEQQNIAVYKKALASVVNITSTAVQFDFFYG